MLILRITEVQSNMVLILVLKTLFEYYKFFFNSQEASGRAFPPKFLLNHNQLLKLLKQVNQITAW